MYADGVVSVRSAAGWCVAALNLVLHSCELAIAAVQVYALADNATVAKHHSARARMQQLND